MAGYSKASLAKKLGFKEGSRVRIKNAPSHYLSLVEPRPNDIAISSRLRKDVDIYHLFSDSYAELKSALPRAIRVIRQDGMIWVSWPKKASGVPTDLTEDAVRKIALPLGLVDVKVGVGDDVWSALKLVIRKELRR